MAIEISEKKILVAIRPADLPIVRATLGSEFHVVVCHSFDDAIVQLTEQIGMIACGVHFDDGAMFDLLRAAKANSITRSVPFFLLIDEGAAYSPAIIEGIRLAAKILGAEALTDLSRLKTEVGEQQAYERLRQSVRKALSDPDY